MNNSEFFYKKANELGQGVTFLSESDDYIYTSCISIYKYIWHKFNDVRGVLSLCALHKRKNKRFKPELLSILQDALKKSEHPDLVVFYCICVIQNHPSKEADVLITQAKDWVKEGTNAYSLFVLFQACVFWQESKFEKYCDGIVTFFENKNDKFLPYIAIPSATAWVGYNEPSGNVSSSFILDVQTLLPTFEPEYIISVSCDSNYLNLYGEVFINSLSRLSDKFYCQISITDSTNMTVQDERIKIVEQNILSNENTGPISSALRYIHAHEFSKNARCPVLVMDFDTAMLKSPKCLIEQCASYDVGLRVLGNVLPWEKITAGFSIFNNTYASKRFLNIIYNFFLHTLDLDDKQWWVDQNAIECAFRFSSQGDFSHINVMNHLPSLAIIPTGTTAAKLEQLKKSI